MTEKVARVRKPLDHSTPRVTDDTLGAIRCNIEAFP